MKNNKNIISEAEQAEYNAFADMILAGELPMPGSRVADHIQD